MKQTQLLLITLFSIAVAACGGGGSSTPASNTISGIAAKGPIGGAEVLVFKAGDYSGVATAGVYDDSLALNFSLPATTDSAGHYSVNVGDYTGPVTVLVRPKPGSTMCNELTGVCNLAFNFRMRAALPSVAANTTAHITPFTEMAAKAVGTSTIPAVINTANALVRTQVLAGLDPLTTSPVVDSRVTIMEQATQRQMVVALAAVAQAGTGTIGTTDCSIATDHIACAVDALSNTVTSPTASGANINAGNVAVFNTAMIALTTINVPTLDANGSLSTTATLDTHSATETEIATLETLVAANSATLTTGANPVTGLTPTTPPSTTTGTLTIIKDAQPNDPQAFHFTTVGAGLSAFDLDDDGNTTNALSNMKTFTNLAAGIPFTVTEDAVSGWTVPSIQCLVAVPGLTTTFTDQLNRTFTVNLEAGANVTCTFINVKTTPTGTGTLTIVKDAQPNDPQAFHFATVGAGLSAFDLDDDGNTTNALSNTKTFTNLAAGIPFTVTEDAVSGWNVPSIQCLVAVPGLTTTFTDQLNRTFTVNLEAGANVTCTFINVKTGSTAFTAIGGPTLQVSTQAIIPTVLQTAIAFTSTGSGNSGTATVTAGPTGVTNDGIFTLASFANPYPVFTLVGAVATLPSSILLSSGTALPMTSSSLGGTAGLTSADFGMWAITNAVSPPLPINSVITYSAFAGGTQLTTTMPNISSKTYTGKMTGVLADTPIGGSDDVSSNISLTVNYASGTGTITGQFTGINPLPGLSTITPCVWPLAASSCTYNLYALSQGLPGTFGDITVNGTVTGNSFTAIVTTPSITGATTTTMTGNFYGANADEIAGTFIISVPSPGPGLILIGSFGAKP